MTRERPLTAGEIELSRTIFKDSIDYRRVRLKRKKWFPFQPRGVVMAPTGHIHFHPESRAWSDDFSKEPIAHQGLFIHEMTHVWQTHKGGWWYLLLMRHPFCRYGYEVRDGKPFRSYGIEQQAEIVRHHFMAQRGRHGIIAPPPNLLPF